MTPRSSSTRSRSVSGSGSPAVFAAVHPARHTPHVAIVAFALTLIFILVPGPYPMAIFTFIAQPLFGIVAIGYLLKVRADLRKRGL